MKPSHLIIFVSAWLLATGIQQSAAQTDRTEVIRLIEQHRQWMVEHTPNPQSLNDSALIIEAVRAIHTVCHEPQVGAMIRHAGQRFALKELMEYAALRDQQGIDRDDAQAHRCLQLLAEEAGKRLGEASYPQAYAEMVWGLTAASPEQAGKVYRRFHETAKALFGKDASTTNHELWLMAQVMVRTIDGYFGENPTLYRDMKLLTQEVFDFYKKYHVRTDVQVYLLQTLENYHSNNYLYENYHAYVNRQLIRSGQISGNQELKPEDIGLAEQKDSTRTVPVQLLAQLLHPSHPDVLYLQIDNDQLLWYGGKPFQKRLSFIQDYIHEYEKPGSLAMMNVKNNLRSWQVINHESLTDTTFQQDLTTLRSHFSDNHFVYFNTLSLELEQLITTQSGLLNEVIASLDSFVSKAVGDDPIKRIYMSSYRTRLQRSGIPGYESAFYDLAQEFLDCCDQHPTWKTIAVGKDMVLSALALGDASTALTLQRRLAALLRRMVGEKDPIFVIEYLQYGQMSRNYSNRPITTLDGDEGADTLFADIIRCSPVADIEVNAYLCAGSYYCHKNQPQKGRAFLNKALALSEQEAGRLTATDSTFIEAIRYNQATAYAELLHSYISKYPGEEFDRSAVDRYGPQLELLLQDMEFEPQLNFNLYYQLSEYYGVTHQFDKAKKLMYECLTYYDNLSGNRVDGSYLQILQTLINISANVENDMDACEALAERLERDIRGFENAGSFENYISLLRTLYDLVEAKNPYDQAMLSSYLNKLESSIAAYLRASNNDEDVQMNHGLYFISKVLNIASMHDQWKIIGMRNAADMEVFDQNWEQLRQNVTNNIIPTLQQMRESIEKQPGGVKLQAERYNQIIMCQAQAADYCTNDITAAEQHYRELAESIGGNGLFLLGQFYLKHGRSDDALSVFQQIDNLFHEPQSFDMQYPSANLRGKINTTGSIFIAYEQANRYTDALRLAREYQQYLSAYINQNLDLMTQNEREALLNGFGTGSLPLLMLLPKMPEQLAADCYDAALRDKGILLRASDRLQRAIAASGNDTLIHAVDSLRMMQQQLGSMQVTDQQTQTQFTTLRDKMDRLERYIARKSAAFRDEQDEVPTWQQVRAGLKKGEAAVEFVASDSALMALVLTADSQQPQYVMLLRAEAAQDMLEMLQQQSPTELALNLYGPGHTALYAQLWLPLEPHFCGATTIYFSATAMLNSLSFAAITLPDGSYLIDHYELHQLTTTARLAHREKKRRRTSQNLRASILGACYYNDEQQEYYQPRLAQMRQAIEADSYLAQNGKQRGQTESFSFLENSLHESDAITRLLSSSGVWAQELVGAEPTEQAIRQLDGRSPDILVVSTHGFFYNDIRKAREIPYLQKRQNMFNAMTATGLILAGGERAWQGEQLADEQDNILSSQEVSTLNLTGTQLAVLSACETGLGLSNNEGVYGLQRGFKQAGVRSLCVSLWSVSDLSTSQLMQSFFRHWLTGKKATMQEAMSAAMKEQRTRTPEPYHWASFVLYDADF